MLQLRRDAAAGGYPPAVMKHPWVAEHAVSAERARSLIERQFPTLAPAQLRPLGGGWDNTAFLVNDAWVFRFPRREIAVSLIETESAVLPVIAPRLTLTIPVPVWCGRPEEGYPWPFSGYRLIPGRTMCSARLDERQRAGLAGVLAEFLASLHAVPVDEARRAGATYDELRRLDVAHRGPQIAERLHQCARLELVEDVGPWMRIVDETPKDRAPRHSTLVHGDLYARHLLVDDVGRPAGVIDWGDVHLGDPAIDLSIAHGALSPTSHDAFRDAYGPIDDGTWRLARFRALHSAVTILVYGHEVGDEDLVREGHIALRHLARGGRCEPRPNPPSHGT